MGERDSGKHKTENLQISEDRVLKIVVEGRKVRGQVAQKMVRMIIQRKDVKLMDRQCYSNFTLAVVWY